MTSRRGFLATAGAAAATVKGRAAARSYAEIETRIVKRDFRDLQKEDLPTPCMVLDLELFEKNLRTMAAHSKATGINLRPHVKIHKSPEISKRQAALGALGVTCATMAECELLVNAGVKGVLHTCQPAGKNKIGRAAALAKRSPTFHCVADDPLTVDLLDEACGAVGTKLSMMVDCYAGLTRQGIEPGAKALALAQKIEKAKNLHFAGVMGYSGDASHTKGWETRKQRSWNDTAGLLETAEMCKKAGMNVPIITGGSTGTYNIDVGRLTELQCGSYVFMDTSYMHIGSKDGDARYHDFESSLAVLTTIISKTRPNQATIDAGNKAMLRTTDQVVGHPEMVIENQGAEYGIVKWKDGDRDLKLGDRVEIYPTNLDTSTNVYDRYYVVKGEQVVDVWPIMGRAGAAQR